MKKYIFPLFVITLLIGCTTSKETTNAKESKTEVKETKTVTPDRDNRGNYLK